MNQHLRDIGWWTGVNHNNLLYSYNDIYNVTISREAYKNIEKYCKTAGLNETGGILIGKYSNDQKTAEVIKITSPPSDSHSTKYSFKRGTKGIRTTLDLIWSQGLYYLGEWHYHPNASAYPSGTDVKQMLMFANNDALKCPEPLLVIVGGNLNNIELFVAVFNNKGYIPLQRIL